jgi:AcrR family transcriptional regulator
MRHRALSHPIKMPKVVPAYKEEAKERIIQAALQVYAEKGPYDATMEDVAKKLGVTKGALYLYFKSKDELLSEIIKRPEQSMRRFLQSLIETDNLSQSLDDLFNRDVEDTSKKRRSILFEFVAEASRNPATRNAFSEAYEQILTTLTDFLVTENEKLKHNAHDSRCQAISLMSLYIGTIASSILGVDENSLKEAWQRSTKAIIAHPSGE